MRTIVFDLDGTLADTSGDLLAAANSCFKALGYGEVLTQDQDAAIALRGGRAMLTRGFERLGVAASKSDIDDQYPVLLDAYDKSIDRLTVLYPGVREAVARLKSRGDKVAICTNKPERLAEKLMSSLGFRSQFDALIGADTLPVRKPDPAPFFAAVDRAGGVRKRAVLVGDSDTDHKTARAAGVPSILVSFGPAGDDMSLLDPDALLDSYEELEAILERVLG
ncbi:MAG: HAD-IA family hydrolase [Pseudomonadota bacterium]